MIKLFAKKSLGQNFLVNPGVVAKIITAAELNPEDSVLEVGPGTGLLTQALVQSGARVIAVEKDRRVIEDLNAQFSAAQTEIVEGDILEFKPQAYGLAAGEYKIVANLPYYITSHFLRLVLEEWPQPISMVLMVQKEVAQRIMAQAPDMNLLALSVQYYARPEIVSYVGKGSFRPEPSVDSAIIKLMPEQKYNFDFSIAKKGFASKRKTLLNNLRDLYPKEKIEAALTVAGLDLNIRAESLTLENWDQVIKNLSR